MTVKLVAVCNVRRCRSLLERNRAEWNIARNSMATAKQRGGEQGWFHVANHSSADVQREWLQSRRWGLHHPLSWCHVSKMFIHNMIVAMRFEFQVQAYCSYEPVSAYRLRCYTP